MSNLSDKLREQIGVFVQEATSSHSGWEVNADMICHHIEQGKLLNPKDIRYKDGQICRINKLELKSGLLLLKEPPPVPKVEKYVNPTVHPLIEELRSRNSAPVKSDATNPKNQRSLLPDGPWL